MSSRDCSDLAVAFTKVKQVAVSTLQEKQYLAKQQIKVLSTKSHKITYSPLWRSITSPFIQLLIFRSFYNAE